MKDIPREDPQPDRGNGPPEGKGRPEGKGPGHDPGRPVPGHGSAAEIFGPSTRPRSARLKTPTRR